MVIPMTTVPKNSGITQIMTSANSMAVLPRCLSRLSRRGAIRLCLHNVGRTGRDIQRGGASQQRNHPAVRQSASRHLDNISRRVASRARYQRKRGRADAKILIIIIDSDASGACAGGFRRTGREITQKAKGEAIDDRFDGSVLAQAGL